MESKKHLHHFCSIDREISRQRLEIGLLIYLKYFNLKKFVPSPTAYERADTKKSLFLLQVSRSLFLFSFFIFSFLLSILQF